MKDLTHEIRKWIMQRRHLPAEQTSDQCSASQCWAGSLDSQESAAETRRQAGK